MVSFERASVFSVGDYLEIAMKKAGLWAMENDLNVPLFYYDYCDSITVENLYQAFKERLAREGFRSEKKRKKKSNSKRAA